jgi:hypothetical protein
MMAKIPKDNNTFKSDLEEAEEVVSQKLDDNTSLDVSTGKDANGPDGSYLTKAAKEPVGDGSIPNRIPTSTTSTSDAANLKKVVELFTEIRDLERASYQAANYQPVINIVADTSPALGNRSTELFPRNITLPYNAEERLSALAQQLIVERVADIVEELGQLGVTVDDELIAFASEEE